MGREIRKVPPNWDHPKQGDYPDRFQPMHDSTFEKAAAEWRDGFISWYAGTNSDRENYKNEDGSYMEFWEWHGDPPDRQYYRPWKDEEATWYQVWETVSEGTPVTPPFATKDELARYLTTYGDFWDQRRGDGPWSEANAKAFCNVGWVPSGGCINGQWLDGKDMAALADSEEPTR